MSIMEPLCSLIGVRASQLSKLENAFLEADLFIKICEELSDIFKERYQDYFRLMRLTAEREQDLLEVNFSHFIISDILSTEEYTIKGIAYYTEIPEETLLAVFLGYQTYFPALYLRRIIELHRSVQKELYHFIIERVVDKYLAVLKNKF